MTCDTTTDDTTPADSSTRKHGVNPVPIEQVLKTLAHKQPGANATYTVSGPHGRNEYCLATLDIQNRWTFPFRVIFSIDNAEDGEGGDAIMDVHSIIQPGTTTR